MKKMDEAGRKLCKAQAELFASSAALTKCSSAVFLRRFMNSSAAERMDNGSFLFEADTNKSIVAEIEEEFGRTAYGKIKYSENELYWMGYLYRYWCYTREKTSRQVYRIIKPAELRDLFFPYHSLDTGAAVERILEAKKSREEDMIERGVAILRRIQGEKKRTGETSKTPSSG